MDCEFKLSKQFKLWLGTVSFEKDVAD